MIVTLPEPAFNTQFCEVVRHIAAFSCFHARNTGGGGGEKSIRTVVATLKEGGCAGEWAGEVWCTSHREL